MDVINDSKSGSKKGAEWESLLELTHGRWHPTARMRANSLTYEADVDDLIRGIDSIPKGSQPTRLMDGSTLVTLLSFFSRSMGGTKLPHRFL